MGVEINKSNIIKDFAIAQIGGPYVYGATGQKCTPPFRRARQAQYPAYADNIAKYCPALSGKQSSCTGCKHDGRLAFDCAQLTRRAAEAAGLSLPSGAKSQFTKVAWSVKGPIEQLPPGQAAFLYRVRNDGSVPHTGIALGDGTEVDARGHASGIVHMPMGKYPWTHYCLLPGMAGGGMEIEMIYTIGSRGAEVVKLQAMLMQAGFTLPQFGADGKFGEETAKAVKGYQRGLNLEATGDVDEGLLAQLEIDSKAVPVKPPDQADTIAISHSAALAFFDALGIALRG